MKNILIVDDSSVVRMSLGYVLKANEYNVVDAVDGVDGLEKSNGQKFDLIITDINMPNMTGIELIERIRSEGNNRYTPILVLTTESGTDMLEKGKSAGATGWIVKPFSNDKLISTVRKVLG